MSDLVSCLEDYTLPLMQFSEAFAVVQVGNWTHRTNEPFFLILSTACLAYAQPKSHCKLPTLLPVHVF